MAGALVAREMLIGVVRDLILTFNYGPAYCPVLQGTLLGGPRDLEKKFSECAGFGHFVRST